MEGSPARKELQKKPLLPPSWFQFSMRSRSSGLRTGKSSRCWAPLRTSIWRSFMWTMAATTEPPRCSPISRNPIGVSASRLCKKFWPPAAVTAGLRHASGDIVAVIDADFQDPVELIPEMLAKWREGYSVVYGVRRNRQEFALKRFSLTASSIGCCRGSPILIFPVTAATFVCSTAAQSMQSTGCLKRTALSAGFAPGMVAARLDFTTIARHVPRDDRAIQLRSCLISPSMASSASHCFRFRFIFWLGLGSFIFAMLGLLFFLAHRIFGFKIFGHTPSRRSRFHQSDPWCSSWVAIQLLSIGVLGEYLGRIYLEVKNCPEYVLSRIDPSRTHSLPSTTRSSTRVRPLMRHFVSQSASRLRSCLPFFLSRNVDLGEATSAAAVRRSESARRISCFGSRGLLGSGLAMAAHAREVRA